MLTSAAQIFVRLPGRRRLCVPAGFTSDDAKFMALAISQAAASAPEVPVGAVIVKDGAVLASARQLPGTLDHAEILAMKVRHVAVSNRSILYDICPVYVVRARLRVKPRV
jgi:tRNA(Arg) A34 adenosine deaminase TadA